MKFSTEIIDKYMPKKGASADEKKKIMATWAQMYWVRAATIGLMGFRRARKSTVYLYT